MSARRIRRRQIAPRRDKLSVERKFLHSRTCIVQHVNVAVRSACERRGHKFLCGTISTDRKSLPVSSAWRVLPDLAVFGAFFASAFSDADNDENIARVIDSH